MRTNIYTLTTYISVLLLVIMIISPIIILWVHWPRAGAPNLVVGRTRRKWFPLAEAACSHMSTANHNASIQGILCSQPITTPQLGIILLSTHNNVSSEEYSMVEQSRTHDISLWGIFHCWPITLSQLGNIPSSTYHNDSVEGIFHCQPIITAQFGEHSVVHKSPCKESPAHFAGLHASA